jgi:hypothetical protein
MFRFFEQQEEDNKRLQSSSTVPPRKSSSFAQMNPQQIKIFKEITQGVDPSAMSYRPNNLSSSANNVPNSGATTATNALSKSRQQCTNVCPKSDGVWTRRYYMFLYHSINQLVPTSLVVKI